MKYIALIPSYEPNNKLIEILKELKSNNFEIVVVNDGSNKSYNYIFENCKEYAKVLYYNENKGKGYALKTGLKYIKGNYKDVLIVTMDSDGQHTVKDAKKLCKIIENENNTILLGKRLRGKNTPIRSKIGNSITRFVYFLTTGVNIYDTQTGLRTFKSELIPFLMSVEGNRFEYEMNVLLEAPKRKIKLKEEIIETIYENNNSGSHFKTIRDSYLIYKQILKFGGSSIISFILDYALFSIFLFFSKNITISNIIARIISCNFNYMINKKIVFKDKKSIKKSILKYYLLAILILTLNTLILNLLVNVLLFNEYISKILVEILLFIISWIIQKRFIF